MNDIVRACGRALQSNFTEGDIGRLLKKIKDEYFIVNFSRLTNEKIYQAIIPIWKFLILASSSDIDKIRVDAYRIASFFLTRTAPFYPKEVQKLFTDKSIVQEPVSPRTAIFMALSFAWMTNEIEPLYVKELIKNTYVLKYFQTTDPIALEHMSTAINNLKGLTPDWYVSLITEYGNALNLESSMALYKCIYAIIKKQPSLLSHFMDFLVSNDMQYSALRLISFMMRKKIDFTNSNLSTFAKAAILVLKDSSSPSDLVSAAFSVLSFHHTSFTLVVQCQATGFVNLTVLGLPEYCNYQFTIDRFAGTAVYLLPLPLCFLRPDAAKDTNQVIEYKFKSIATQAITAKRQKLLEIMETFEEFLYTDYNEKSSAAIRSFALCVGKLAKSVAEKRITRLIRHIIFMPKVSWYHKLDVVILIRAIGPRMMLDLLQRIAYDNVVDMLIEFCLDNSAKLRDEAVPAITEFATVSGAEPIVERMLERIDMFDMEQLEKVLLAASEVGDKASSLDSYSLEPVALAILEALTFNEINLALITVAFRFLSLMNLAILPLSAFGDLPPLVAQIVGESINFLTGSQIKTKGGRYLGSQIRAMIESSFASRPFEILSKCKIGREEVHSQLSYALRLFSKMPVTTEIAQLYSSINEHTVQLFPRLCSECLNKFIQLLSKSDRVQIFKTMTTHMKNLPNLDVAGQWIRIVADESFRPAVNSSPHFMAALNETITSVPSALEFVEPRTLLVYSKYAATNDHLKKCLVSALNCMSPDNRREFLIRVRRMDNLAAFAICDDPPNIPIDFSDGIDIAIRQMIGATRRVYEEIQNRVIKRQMQKTSTEGRRFILEQLSSDLLSETSKTKHLNPLIAVQLRHGTREFSLSQLAFLIAYYAENLEKENMELALQIELEQAHFTGEQSCVLKVDFPKEMVPYVMAILKRQQAREINDFIDKFRGSVDPNIKFALHCADSDDYFANLIFNNDAKSICKNFTDISRTISKLSSPEWNALPIDDIMLQDKIRYIVSSSNKFGVIGIKKGSQLVTTAGDVNLWKKGLKRMATALMTTGEYFAATNISEPKFIDDFINAVINVRRANVCISDNHILALVRTFYDINSDNDASRQLALDQARESTKELLKLISSSSRANPLITTMVMKRSDDFYPVLEEAAKRGATSIVPSLFIDACDITAAIAKKGDVNKYNTFIRNCIRPLFDASVRFYGIPKAMRAFQNMITELYDNRLPDPSPDFALTILDLQGTPDYNILQPAIISAIGHHSVKTSTVENILSRLLQNIRTPPTYDTFDTYVACVIKRATTIQKREARLEFINTCLQRLLARLPDLDSYIAAEIIYSIVILIMYYNDYDFFKSFEYALKSMYTSMRRFLPFFAAIRKFIQDYGDNEIIDFGKKAQDIVWRSINKTTSEIHIAALQYLFNPLYSMYCPAFARFPANSKEGRAFKNKVINQGKSKK